MEAITPIDLLRRCQVEVTTVGVTGKQVQGAHGIILQADITMDACTCTAQDSLVLPGGMPGTTNLMACQALCDMLETAHQNGQLIAAICAAPSVILGGLGLLDGRHATCFPGMEGGMTGAVAHAVSCVVEGNLITARGAGAAFDFAAAIADALCGKPVGVAMAQKMCYDNATYLVVPA